MVWGIPSPIAGKINKPIASFLGKKKISFSENSKEAITLYKTIQIYYNKFSLIECKTITGRTHQIRVHMLEKGCPLIGDKVYAKGRNIQKNTKDKIVNLIDSFNRHALHAKKLLFFTLWIRDHFNFDAKKT